MKTDSSTSTPMALRVYSLITGDEDARVCKDIPESACRHQPGNFLKHLLSSAATKIGDELASAKLVLPWLLSTLGAPAFLSGFLVPIRESGALVPQLFVAGAMRPFPVRKWFWVAGSLLQGLCLLAMAAAALLFRGAAAGWLLVLFLVIFSLSRGVCSVASKDVLGKTVSKQRRGTVMGYAGALAGGITIIVGVGTKALGEESRADHYFFAMLLLAALLWIAAALVFARVREEPGATEGGANAVSQALESVKLLKTDVDFRRYLITRALLLSTALSFPFYVVLRNEQAETSLSGLGLLFIASGVGGTLSAPVWGRLADRSSRKVQVLAAAVAGILGLLVFALSRFDSPFIRDEYAFSVFFLVLGMAHSGVRLGRKTYLVDLATADNRAAYVAVSNTAIGLLMLLGGAFGAAAQLLGTRYVILLLALTALAGASSAMRLKEVE